MADKLEVCHGDKNSKSFWNLSNKGIQANAFLFFLFFLNASSRLIWIHPYSTAVFSCAHPTIAWEISWHFRYMLYMKAIIELGGKWRYIGAITLFRHILKSYKTFLACRGFGKLSMPVWAPNWNSPNSSWVWWVWGTLLLLFFLTPRYKQI